MKKYAVLTLFALAYAVPASASLSYECWRYIDDEPQGYVKVVAENNDEAVEKAKAKFRNIGKKHDYVKCK